MMPPAKSSPGSGDPFPELRAVLDLIERGGPYASAEELNRLLASRMREYNERPQAALGGLSPREMRELLGGDWATHGVMLLADALPIEELAGSALLADARTLLAWVRDEGPVKETAAGNLPRAALAALLPRLRMPAQRRIAVHIGEPAPRNEGDVLWLPALRQVLMFAGLLVRRRGLRTTTLGRELLDDARAGTLYALVFRTFFQQLDLRVLDRSDGHPGLQRTVAWSFYRLQTTAKDWASSESLADVAWLPSAKDPPSEWEAANVDLRHYSFRHRVLDPLVEFGLLEQREMPSEDRWVERVEYRRTPLFNRFLRFQLVEGRRQPLVAR